MLQQVTFGNFWKCWNFEKCFGETVKSLNKNIQKLSDHNKNIFVRQARQNINLKTFYLDYIKRNKWKNVKNVHFND